MTLVKSLYKLISKLVVEIDRKKLYGSLQIKHVGNHTLKSLFSVIPAKGCFFYYLTSPAS